MFHSDQGQSNNRSLGSEKEAMGSAAKKFSILGYRNVLVYLISRPLYFDFEPVILGNMRLEEG